jgi:hypothetical protein
MFAVIEGVDEAGAMIRCQRLEGRMFTLQGDRLQPGHDNSFSPHPEERFT